jgi:hypothetical protein
VRHVDKIHRPLKVNGRSSARNDQLYLNPSDGTLEEKRAADKAVKVSRQWAMV